MTTKSIKLLKFSLGNAKLGKRLIFSLPAGYTCRQAGVCRTMADHNTGKIIDLPSYESRAAEYRCFAAVSETRPNVRDARWYNWNLIKETVFAPGDPVQNLASLIELSIACTSDQALVRIHESGDFFAKTYFLAWCEVAKRDEQRCFYAYTKELKLWKDCVDSIPSNLFLTASAGGKLDHMLSAYPDIYKRIAYVCYTEEEAAARGLEVDHDDSHCFGDKPFALLVHAPQRAGSAAQQAITERKRKGQWTGYSHAR